MATWARQTDDSRDIVATNSVIDRFSAVPTGIRCPLCHWRPSSHDLWFCADVGAPEYYLGGCGTAWNTFETRGRCPGCSHQWRWTVCHACERWSPHPDWYADDNVI